jgi:DNA-directed RNA polymerase specialized sigma24 family protein
MDGDGQARPGTRRSWALTPGAFDGLLAALDADRDRAAVAYERLRDRLIGLLRWWGATQPEELADQTLDRVARKLEGGADVPNESIGAYVRGVGRMVFHEWTRRPRPEHAAIEVAAMAAGDDDHQALTELDACLAALAADDRRLLLRYYGDGRAADVRRKLADELGLSPTALRIRAHRIRARIEAAVKHSPGCAHPYQGERKGEAP